MEEKGVRDRKREPEEYNFDYEELADAEVDSEQAGRRDDAVWETTCDTVYAVGKITAGINVTKIIRNIKKMLEFLDMV